MGDLALPCPRPPRLPARLVPRDALLRRLDRLPRVTVLEALSGHGKTTLMAVWAEQRRARGDRVVWMHPDDAADVSEVLERCSHENLRDAAPDPSERRTIVVVDELDSITDPQAVDVLCASLVRDHRLHLVVGVSTAHPIAPAARRADLDVQVVSGADLTIAVDDVPAFAEAWGHTVDEDGARRLHALLGGWLLPLRLVLDATPAGADELATDAATEFFEQTVLPEVLDESAKTLATRVALTTPVTPETVAAAASGVGCSSSDAERHLAELERAGLLQRVVDAPEPQWRIPTLVRRSLLAAFERTSLEEQVRCHRSMGELLHRTRAPLGSVLRHARLGLHWALLADLWEEHALQLAIDDPEAAVEAYASVPDEVLGELPALAVPRAVTAALATSPDDPSRATVLRSYAELGRALRFDAAAARTPAELVDVGVAVMIARRDSGDLAGARRLGTELSKRLSAMPKQSTGARLRACWLALQRGMNALVSGDLPAAAAWCGRAVDLAPEVVGDFAASHAAGIAALVHAVQGGADEADRWLAAQQRHATPGPWLDRVVTAPARMAQAVLAIDRLDRDEATRLLDDLAEGVAELWPFLIHTGTQHALYLGEPMRMLARLDHLAALHRRHLVADGLARRVVDRCRADLLIALGEANQAHRLTEGQAARPAWLAVPAARLHLAAGEPAVARRVVSAWAGRDAVSPRDRVELLMIAVAAAAAMNDEASAVAGLAEARASAATIGLDHAELLLPQAAADRFGSSSMVRQDGARRPYPDSVRLVRLSPRETVVLDLLQEHASLASIARRLSVSVNTVKKQTVAIYAKLGVHDRASALLEARRLGLSPRAIPGPNLPPRVPPRAAATDNG